MNELHSSSTLFGDSVLERYRNNKGKSNERGERLKLIAQRTGYAIPFIGKKLKGMHDISTLDYIISVCKDAELTGRKGWKHNFDSVIKTIWTTNSPRSCSETLVSSP